MSDKPQLQAAEQALDSVNSASALSRTLYISFIALTGYITVNLLSTDDMQILRYTPLRLPLLGVDIELKGFYALVPWLYVVVLVNMLLVFSLLARKLHHFEALLTPLSYPDRLAFRKRLHVFGLAQVVSGKNKGLLGLMLNATLWITTSLVPVALLLWIQLRFLPAQEQGVIWSQRCAVLIGAALVFYFWHRIMRERRRALMPKNWKPRLQRRLPLGSWVLLGFSLFSIWISIFVAMAPLGQWERMLNSTWLNQDCPNNLKPHHWKTAAELDIDSDEYKKTKTEFDRAMQVALEEIKSSDRKDNLLAKVIAWLPFDISDEAKYRCTFDSSHWLSDSKFALFPRQLRETESRVIVENTPSAEQINQAEKWKLQALTKDEQNKLLDHFVGINLNRRSLRFAHLNSSVMFKTQLLGSQLQGADLSEALLQGADLGEASLQRADLSSASLQKTLIYNVSAQGANFDYASLQGAYLSETRLQRAYLHNASLQEADLGEAQLQGADLREAQLQGAFLYNASLQGADLSAAWLQGADLREASLQGADLSEALLQGADLREALLQGADLREALLLGANLSEASLQGANLSEASLQGADLSGASLQGADLHYANSLGTSFRYVGLHDTILTGIDLSLSDWTGAHYEPMETSERDALITNAVEINNFLSRKEVRISFWIDRIRNLSTIEQPIFIFGKLKTTGDCIKNKNELSILPCGTSIESAHVDQPSIRFLHRKHWSAEMTSLICKDIFPLSVLGGIRFDVEGVFNTARTFDYDDDLYTLELFSAMVDRLVTKKACQNSEAISTWLSKNHSGFLTVTRNSETKTATIEQAWMHYQNWQKERIQQSKKSDQ